MDGFPAAGEASRAAQLITLRVEPADEPCYKGVPHVDIETTLKTINRFHARPANSFDNTYRVFYPPLEPKFADLANGASIFRSPQTEDVTPANLYDYGGFERVSAREVTHAREAPSSAIRGERLF